MRQFRGATPATGLLLAFSFAMRSFAQVPLPTPPPVPEIAPTIIRTYPNDRNGDAIEDSLYERAVAASAQGAGNELVDVEAVFDKQIIPAQIEAFDQAGGTFEYVYQTVSYGWTGKIPLNRVAELPARLGFSLVLVEEAKPLELYLDLATRNGRVRPVWADGFAGSANGFDGNSNITIAIVDTGVDESHTDLAGRQQYWHDFTTDAAASPVDIEHHGSHVAGIALGTGAAGGSAQGTLHFTDNGSLSGVAKGSFYPSPFSAPATTFNWTSNVTWTGSSATYYHLNNTGSGWASLGNTSGTSPLNWTQTGIVPNSGAVYSQGLVQNTRRNITDYVITHAVTNYPAAPDGFNKFRGVAPGCNWAGAKVFTNSGSGLSTWIGAAIDALVTSRAANNIKIMNLSLGINGSPGLDTTTRQKVNTAVDNGIVVAVAAGNDGFEAAAAGREVDDPGRAAKVLTVAAMNDNNALTDYTSQGFTSPGSTAGQEEGYKPDLAAPGGSADYFTSVMSVDSNDGDGGSFSDQQANDYFNIQGTSMATPFAAGCAALVIDAMQEAGAVWDFSGNDQPLFVKMVLCATATESNANRENGANNPTLQRTAAGPSGFPAGKDLYEGYGLINPDAAVEAVSLSYSGGSVGGTFGGGVYDRRAWARQVPLMSGVQAHFVLDVPATGDFDLYLYSQTPNLTAPHSGEPVILGSSTTAGNGTAAVDDEQITFTPGATETGILVVKRISGSGSFALSGSVAAPPEVDLNGGGGGFDNSNAFTEGGGAASIAASGTITDLDSASLASLTVTNTNHQTSDTLSATGIGGIAITPYDGGTGVLLLSGPASVGDYQSALRSVTFSNGSHAPAAVSRSITVVANDGVNASNTGTCSMSVIAVNNPPALVAPGTQSALMNQDLVFSSGGGNGFSISDVDAGSNDLTVDLAVTSGTLTLGTTAGLTSATGDGTASVSMDGPVSALNNALNGLDYLANQDFLGTDTLNIQVNDNGNSGSGGAQSDSGAVAIHVEALSMLWVDFEFAGPHIGTESNPLNSLSEAVKLVAPGGTIEIKAGATSETMAINRSMRIEAVGGLVTVGAAP